MKNSTKKNKPKKNTSKHTEANSQKELVANILGEVDWTTETQGYCNCPGKDNHTTATQHKDCILYLDHVPTIYCFHGSCSSILRTTNAKLRKAICDSEEVEPSNKERKRLDNERLESESLRKRAYNLKGTILKKWRWTSDQITKDSPIAIPEQPVDHWKQLLGLFNANDVVWIGDKHDSGKQEHKKHFRPASEWLKESSISGPYICPAVFKTGSYSRSNDNVQSQPFIVVESDILSRDEVGAVFRWLQEEVGLNLVAVVDTAGKSLHGWFQHPSEEILDEMKLILPALGCDPKLFTPSQPVRLPGVLRGDKYQKLLYLNQSEGGVPKSLVSSLPLPEVYYQKPDFWVPGADESWGKATETQMKLYLRDMGYSDKAQTGLSEVETTLLRITQHQNVSYAGNLAGYNAGLYNINGKRVFITESPKLIEPKAGEWPILHSLLEGMFNVQPEDQRPHLYGWLKIALESLQAGNWSPGQAIALAGPPNSGKSLWQRILTRLFGGRSAKPYSVMTGDTTFNSHLFSAEHLIVEDDCERTENSYRRHFASRIKQIAVNNDQECHPKGKEASQLSPWWRLSITLNDNPERLLVLPPIEDDLADKIMLFKIAKKDMPMPTETPEQQKAFWNALMDELPAFVDFILKYEIPADLRSPRFGIKHYHHPELLRALNETSPESRLLELIDRVFFGNGSTEPIEMLAVDIQSRLCDKDNHFSREASQLFTHQNACGCLMGKLANSYPDRVKHKTVNGRTHWILSPPAENQQGGEVETVSYFNDKNEKINNNKEHTPCWRNPDGGFSVLSWPGVRNLLHLSTQTGREAPKPPVIIALPSNEEAQKGGLENQKTALAA